MSNIEFIKKKSKGNNEISNLKLFLNICPDIIPQVKIIESNYYLLEKCSPIEEKDFSPQNFLNLYNYLLEKLYQHTHKDFSRGIYKYYFNRDADKKEFINKYYIPYLVEELEKAVQQLKIHNNKTIIHLLNECKERAKPFLKWYPADRFNLLHGDLHIGNIVKKRENYFLIDYEYVRYGAKELEIANFIVSCLIFYGMHNNANTLNKICNRYLTLLKQSNLFHYNLFLLFLLLSSTLCYITALIKNNGKGISIISEIFKAFSSR
ncbi:MAG: phosphotransferase [Bacteroidetes bacterium]|nr:phosphotransferase [Bacteroidota bacterium]